jgi:hypothetical protein
MSEVLLLYVFTRLDAARVLLAVTITIAPFFVLIMSMVASDHDTFGRKEKEAKLLRARNWIIGLFAFAAIGVVILPTKTDMAIIVGGKLTIDIARSDTAKEIGNEVLAAVRAQLKKAVQ